MTNSAIATGDGKLNTPILNNSAITILAITEYFHTSFHHTVAFFSKDGKTFRTQSPKRKREIHGQEDLPAEAELIPAMELLPPKLPACLTRSADGAEDKSGLSMLS